jgi:hypothetical protein
MPPFRVTVLFILLAEQRLRRANQNLLMNAYHGRIDHPGRA